jgi:hypothetical protein
MARLEEAAGMGRVEVHAWYGTNIRKAERYICRLMLTMGIRRVGMETVLGGTLLKDRLRQIDGTK